MGLGGEMWSCLALRGLGSERGRESAYRFALLHRLITMKDSVECLQSLLFLEFDSNLPHSSKCSVHYVSKPQVLHFQASFLLLDTLTPDTIDPRSLQLIEDPLSIISCMTPPSLNRGIMKSHSPHCL